MMKKVFIYKKKGGCYNKNREEKSQKIAILHKTIMKARMNEFEAQRYNEKERSKPK